jgi:hypothetical protein
MRTYTKQNRDEAYTKQNRDEAYTKQNRDEAYTNMTALLNIVAESCCGFEVTNN